jgi:uncharacterized protein
MDLTHRFVVPAPLDTTWAVLTDAERIAPCFPGATISTVQGDDFTGSVRVKLGPVVMLYSGSGTFVERDATQHRAVVQASGQDERGNGTAAVTLVAHLRPEADGTVVDVTSDLTITGKPAEFGRGVVQDVSDRLLDEFVGCILGQLGDRPSTAAELNLVSAVLPVMLRRYGLPIAGIVVLAVIVWFVAR